jgi:hypothetical protein
MIVLGAVAVLEARRLFALREEMMAGAVVGDDTFPLLVGVSLLALGVFTLFFATLPALRVTFPVGPQRAQILTSAGVLFGYALVVPHLGYTASTFLAAAGLFGGIGGYHWPTSLLLAALATVSLHLMFRVWLLQPLPTGWLGI